MKRLILATCIIFMSLSFVWAADEALVVPHTFENGTVADAEQMNEVISAIQAIMNANLVVMYDYGTPANTTKVFAHTSSLTTLTSIINELGMETWTYSDGSSVEYLTIEGSEGIMDIGRRMYNTDGSLYQDLTYDPPILGVYLSGLKEMGKVWGGGYIAKKPDESIYGAEALMFSILAIEDVTVPAGTFTNCIKIYHITTTYKAVAWYADGVGMVKRIGWIGPGGNHGLMELQSIE